MVLDTIGIKHDFLCINICWGPKEVLKHELGFNTSLGAQQMLMYQKSMFDCYNCIKTFCRSKTLEKSFIKFFFPVPIMARKGMLPAKVLKTPLHVTDADVTFYDGPRMPIRKT